LCSPVFTFKYNIFFLIKIFQPSIYKSKRTFSPRTLENVSRQCNSTASFHLEASQLDDIFYFGTITCGNIPIYTQIAIIGKINYLKYSNVHGFVWDKKGVIH